MGWAKKKNIKTNIPKTNLKIHLRVEWDKAFIRLTKKSPDLGLTKSKISKGGWNHQPREVRPSIWLIPNYWREEQTPIILSYYQNRCKEWSQNPPAPVLPRRQYYQGTGPRSVTNNYYSCTEKNRDTGREAGKTPPTHPTTNSRSGCYQQDE